MVGRAQQITKNRGKFDTKHLRSGASLFAVTLVELGPLDEAKSEVKAALALNPNFTLRRYRAGAQSDNPDFLKRRERNIEVMRKAGVSEE